MACGRVAVKIQRSGVFQDSMQFQKAICHHHQVGHHIVLAKELTERSHNLSYLSVGLRKNLDEFLFRFLAPMPGIFKCLNLRT